MEDAESTSGSTRSKPRLKLLCDPSKLPKPALEQGRAKKLSEMPKETARDILFYYSARKQKHRAIWFEKQKQKRRRG